MSEIKQIFGVEQNPIIEYSSLDRIASEVDRRLAVINVNSLVIDEENVKSIKTLRTELKKEFDEYESIRKYIKQTILNPYDAFEADYKAKIASKFKDADTTLKVAIDNVENGVKQKKENEIREYFEDYAFVKEIDFVKFEQANIKVGLTDSVKSLKENAKQFIDNIVIDLDLINTQPNKERILVRYRNSLDARGSIANVMREVEQERLMAERIAKTVTETDLNKEVINCGPEIMAIPFAPIEIHEPEEMITVSFTVTGTKKQIISVREFMKQGGIKYE